MLSALGHDAGADLGRPVKPTFATRGSFTRALPTAPPGPGSTEIASDGSPASSRMSASRSTESGVRAGSTTIVLPQARAGAIFHEAMTMGKFQGVMRAQTPMARAG